MLSYQQGTFVLKSLHTLSCHLINGKIIFIEIKHIIVKSKWILCVIEHWKEPIVAWLPEQVTPSPLNPVLHAQVKLPSVFVHIPLVSSQLSASVAHSSISIKENNRNIIQIELQECCPTKKKPLCWSHYTPCLAIW